jgi:bromodomain-containing factor 1
MNRPVDLASDKIAQSLAVNGAEDANIHSFSTNQSITMPLPDVSVESRPIEASSTSADDLNSPPLDPDSTPRELPQVDVPPTHPVTDSVLDSAIDTSVEDTAAVSTFPPVVEPPESDARDDPAPRPPAQEAPAEAQPEQASTGSDLDTNGVPALPAESSESKSASDLSFAASALEPSPPALAGEVPQQATADPEPHLPPTAALDTDVLMGSDPSPTEPATEPLDTEMSNTLQPASAKVAREREDDNELEPSAKRTKTEDETESQDLSAPQTGEPAPAKLDTNPISPYEAKEIVKILKNVLRTNDGKNFRAPVATLWPSFAEAYNAKISNPIDLGAIEPKVKDGKYPTWGDFKADIQLLYDNAFLFNGDGHIITKAADNVRNSVFSKIAAIPAEPALLPKTARKQAKRSTPQAESTPRATSARRQSRSAGTAAAPSAGPSAAPAPTFALDPSTSTPLIRRDSTKNESGRPKREIHPPKNKDLPYPVRPKTKKFATELRFCDDVLTEMKKPKHAAFASAFYVPVDPVALNIPNYFTTIKNPMDISTVTKKLQGGAYQRAKDFEADVRLIFSNCYKFNPAGNPVREMGRQLEAVFNDKWATKNQWISEHAPAALSPSSSAGSEDEESEEEEEVEQPVQSSAASALSARLIEEQNKLITLIQAKKPDQTLITMQQDMVALIQSRIEQENAKNVTSSKKAPKKAKAPKAAKKAAPSKKAAGGPGKKGSASRQRYLGTLEKETISAGLASLPDEVSESVLTMIKADKPDVDVSPFHHLVNVYTKLAFRLLMMEPWNWTLMSSVHPLFGRSTRSSSSTLRKSRQRSRSRC